MAEKYPPFWSFMIFLNSWPQKSAPDNGALLFLHCDANYLSLRIGLSEEHFL
jgi:hypothetical protein